MKLSLGWKTPEGYSENQEKSFSDEQLAFEFCKRNIEKIMRIGTTRFQRGAASYGGDAPEVKITDDDIRKAIKQSMSSP